MSPVEMHLLGHVLVVGVFIAITRCVWLIARDRRARRRRPTIGVVFEFTDRVSPQLSQLSVQTRALDHRRRWGSR